MVQKLTRRAFIKALGTAATIPAMAGATGCVYVTVTPHRAPHFGKRIMSRTSQNLESHMIDVDGLPVPERELPMHYLESTSKLPDDAPVVVMVHGLALSGQYMVPTAEELASFCKVYVPDLPGFGDSGKPSCVLDVPGLAQSLAAWMAEMGLGPVILMGNSFGCQIIAEFAARFPHKTKATILQGPTTDPDERSWLMQFIRWQQNAKFNPPKMGEVAAIDYDKTGIVRALTTFNFSLQHQMAEVLPQVEAPTLVVRGAKDPIVRQNWAEQVVKLLPHAELVLIPGVAHTLVFTAPQKLVEAVRPFIIRTTTPL